MKHEKIIKRKLSKRGQLVALMAAMQIAIEDLQFKVAAGRPLDLFKDFKLLHAIREDMVDIKNGNQYIAKDWMLNTFDEQGKLLVKNFIDLDLFRELKAKHTS